MEGYPNSSHLVEALRPEAQESKKRKVLQKTVVTVKVEPNDEKRRSDGPPSDYWSWRKYGQKPIKGSPYPRGYYRCSTSKGCSAKKQVERSGADASVLIITYTSTHNHPDPDFSTNSLCLTLKQSKEQIIPKSTEGISTPAPQNSEQEQQPRTIPTDEDQFQFVSSSQDALPFAEKAGDPTAVIVPFDGEPLHRPHQKNLPSEENDFFDELEELPTSSPFTRSSFFDERSLVQQQKQSS